MISYDDFAKLDIRIGTIKEAEPLPDADKLLKLIVDVGEAEPRQIIAGIAQFVDASELPGSQIPVLTNLEPKTLRGHESQGMILAGSHENGFALLHPSEEVPPGSSAS